MGLIKGLKKAVRVAGTITDQSQPDFIIIGAQKAGTTALFSILDQHSSLQGSRIKEVHYFDDDDWYGKQRHYEYHAYFPPKRSVPEGQLLFEATPRYMYHSQVAQRLHDYKPDLKLIAVLRDPAERALSAWHMYHHHFKEGEYRQYHDARSFTEVVEKGIATITKTGEADDKGIISRGLYAPQLARYYEHFDKQQLLVLESNELKGEFDNAMVRVCDFLQVGRESLSYNERNKRREEKTEDELRALDRLRTFYKPYNEALFAMLGKKYDWN